jgi:hypothetical protein
MVAVVMEDITRLVAVVVVEDLTEEVEEVV